MRKIAKKTNVLFVWNNIFLEYRRSVVFLSISTPSLFPVQILLHNQYLEAVEDCDVGIGGRRLKLSLGGDSEACDDPVSEGGQLGGISLRI
jgi:hypothetical protein